MNDKTLAIIEARSIAAFATQDIEDALRSALPNGTTLSTAQIHGAAIAAKVGDRNPFTGEMHITNIGNMNAAAAELGDANEWLRQQGDKADWEYFHLGSMGHTDLTEQCNAQGISDQGDDNTLRTRLCEKLNINLSVDEAVLVRLYRLSTQTQWRTDVQLALKLASTADEIAEVKRLYGFRSKWDTEAWGIVRFAEQKDTKNGKTAREKWADMDAMMNRVRRAEKRGRSACVTDCIPVTTAMRRNWRSQANPIQADGELAPATLATPQMRTPDRVDIVDGVVTQAATQTEPQPDDTDVADAEFLAATLAAQHETGDENNTNANLPTQTLPPFAWPDDVLRERDLLLSKASNYRMNNRSFSDRQESMTLNVLARTLCKNSDAHRHAITEALCNQTHWGDVDLHTKLALLNDWLRVVKDEKGYYQPSQSCCASANAIWKAAGLQRPEAKQR